MRIDSFAIKMAYSHCFHPLISNGLSTSIKFGNKYEWLDFYTNLTSKVQKGVA